MDKEGYPERHELNKIKNWDVKDFPNLIDFIEVRWTYRRFNRKVIKEHDSDILEWQLSTAGWSGNESIINAMLENKLFCMLWYHSWRRGGHYVFRINPCNVGYIKVADWCKSEGVTRQWAHKIKDKFQRFEMSEKKVFVLPNP